VRKGLAAPFQLVNKKIFLHNNENNHDGINCKEEELFIVQKEFIFSQQATPPPTACLERGGTIAPFIIG